MNGLSVAQLVLHPPEDKGSVVRLAASLLEADGSRQQLWWELPTSAASIVTPWADPWVVALLFPIMQRRRSVHIKGRVTPSLLAHVDRFMHVWAMWRPDKYQPAELVPDDIVEQPPAIHPGVAVASFSCGLDSCFTVYRHARSLAGRHPRRIGLGIMQHGFDVRLDQENSAGMFRSLLSDATIMLESLDVPCVPMTTNFRRLDLDWADAYGTQLAAGMMLLSRGYDAGLIANDLPYFELGPRPWGLHPVTSGLLGTDRFKIIEDGFEYSRIEKAKTVADWAAGHAPPARMFRSAQSRIARELRSMRQMHPNAARISRGRLRKTGFIQGRRIASLDQEGSHRAIDQGDMAAAGRARPSRGLRPNPLGQGDKDGASPVPISRMEDQASTTAPPNPLRDPAIDARRRHQPIADETTCQMNAGQPNTSETGSTDR